MNNPLEMDATADTGSTPVDVVPVWLVRWGGIAWRLLAIGLVVFYAFQALKVVTVVVLAALVAMFLASVLWKPALRLQDAGWPPGLASITILTAAIAVLAGVFSSVIPAVASNFENISADVTEAGESVRDWLINGPLGLTETQIDSYRNSFFEWLQTRGSDSVIGGATTAVEFITGFFLAVIIVFFILKDGRRMVAGLLDRLPEEKAEKVDMAIRVGWDGLARYMAGLALVGLFDAFLIGLGLLVVGVPLVLPLAVLVFFGAFFPLVGAFVSGLVAVAVAFVNGGLVDALIILAVITAVQQVEGDVILPLVFGRTLKLHPLLILLGVAGGGIAFGLAGAFLTVPVLAIAITIRQTLADDPNRTYTSLAQGVD